MVAPIPPSSVPLRRRRSLTATPRADVGGTAETRPRPDTPEDSYRALPKPARWILGGLAVLGACESMYLTYMKLQGGAGSICSTTGCFDVLTGPFSTVLGIPLSAFGFLAYSVFAALSLWPLGASESKEYVDVDAGTTRKVSADEVYKSRDAATRAPMLGVAATMVGFSSYLMFVLFQIIGDFCPYCVFSACLSSAIFLGTLGVRAVRKFRTAARVAAGGLGVAAAAAVVSFAWAAPMVQPTPESPQAPLAVTGRSSADAMRVAGKLKARGTKMYGAYWCSHCHDQKERLGKRAWAMIEYVECDKHGVNSQATLCRQKRIPGYPTWEIDGKLFPGEIRLEDLETIAGEE